MPTEAAKKLAKRLKASAVSELCLEFTKAANSITDRVSPDEKALIMSTASSLRTILNWAVDNR